MPAVFIGHGSPMNTLEHNRYTDAWRALGRTLPRPRAIVAISAHWVTQGTAVTAMDRPRTIHDFGGFPDELFAVQYPAPGEPALAARIRELLAPVAVHSDHHWGLDHGTWSILAHVYPDASIPVVQLSLDSGLEPRTHYELAKRLAPLRNDGVLIIGSGNVVHHLGMIRWAEDAPPYDWATHFNNRVRGWLRAGNPQPLIEYREQGRDAALSIPTPEHYLPLLYVLAQQQAGETVEELVDGIEYGSIGMLAIRIGVSGTGPEAHA